MSWKDEYKAAAGRFVLKNGSPREMERDTTYGWLASDWNEVGEHLRAHAADEVTLGEFQDVEWSQFDGTFVDDSEHQGIEVTVTCACGRLTDRVWRYEGTLGEILTGILKED